MKTPPVDGRAPSYKYGTTTFEWTLGSWLARQRTRRPRGTLATAPATAALESALTEQA
ncbi:hypothetical protein ACTXMB_03420 [Arthrobacter rhombi]|uniref:hypothetical protein n=1 Tax=Arthrobacter rhombi TaxID=71253 RepID=UPI003FD6434D